MSKSRSKRVIEPSDRVLRSDTLRMAEGGYAVTLVDSHTSTTVTVTQATAGASHVSGGRTPVRFDSPELNEMFAQVTASSSPTLKRKVAVCSAQKTQVDPLYAHYKQMGVDLGLTGVDLARFVSDQLAAERQENLRRQEMERQESLRREMLANQKQELENQRAEQKAREQLMREEKELLRQELAKQRFEQEQREARQERIRSQELDTMKEALDGRNKKPTDSYKVKIEAFDDSQDIDSYLQHYEKIATVNKWDKSVWLIRLVPLLTGKAREVYLSLTPAEADDYETLKKALLQHFSRTAEYYQRLFREARKRSEETFEQFLKRIKVFLDRWIQLSDCNPKNAEELYDFFLREQLFSILSPEIAVKVREAKASTAKEIAVRASEVLAARVPIRLDTGASYGRFKRGYDHAHKKDHHTGNKWDQKNKDQKGQEKKEGSSHGFREHKDSSSKEGKKSRENVVCYKCDGKGHYARECKKQASVKAIISPTKTPSSKDKAVFDPECKVKINGQIAKGFRDTGATDTVVKSKFVKPGDYLGQTVKVEMADPRFSREYPLAVVDVESDFLTGKVVAIVIDHIRPDLFLGNQARLVSHEWVPVPVIPESKASIAVQTRAQAKKETKKSEPVPVVVVEGIDVTPEQFGDMQKADQSLDKAFEASRDGLPRGKSGVKYKISKGILKRHFEKDGNVYSQVCVPQQLRLKVMKIAHDTPMAGHLGAKKTQERIWGEFYWPGMCADIRRYCISCDRCQKITPKGRVSKVPLGKMPLAHDPFDRVAVDIVGPLKPASEKGNRYILVMVDYATRYPEAIPLKTVESEEVAEALWVMWSRLGIPREVLTDRGTQFTGAVMQEVYRLLAVKGLTTTPYHAQCNGLVERFNGTLKSMIRKLVAENPRQWDRMVPAVLFAYREVPQESTGFSPFELLYGRTVRGPMSVLRNQWTKEESGSENRVSNAYVLELRNRIAETCEIARKSLEKESTRQKRHFDLKTKKREFKPGDRVLLLLPEKNNKLEMEWRGPYLVQTRVGEADYQIMVKGKKKLFHANLLKKYVERIPSACGLAVVEDTEDWEEPQITKQGIPVISLEASESVEDVQLDPEAPEMHQEIRELTAQFKEVLTDLPLRTNLATCDIRLEHDKPVSTKQYPLPFNKTEVVVKEVDTMLKMGVIERSKSPYSSPIVLVEKSDGKIRFCIDYRKLNKIVIFDNEPMPCVDYLFAKIGKAKYFSKIDLCKGYWQIPMLEEDKHKTAFVTPQGCFQWTVMPFGLKTAGAVFSRMMRELLSPLGISDEISNFMDDLLIATETKERHIYCLRVLFQRLREVQLAARPTKCYLGFKKLSYLGHVIEEGKITPEESKVQKIQKAARPVTKKQVRSFLGLVGFYRSFIENFSTVALPLTEATKKGEPNVIQWNQGREESFDALKRVMSENPVCILPNMDKDFFLRTDASDVGLGAVLLQDHGQGLQPVAYASKKLSGAERNYSTIEKECFAIVWAVGKYQPYLYGRTFVIQTDHHPLQFLNQMKATNKRLMRWALMLQPFSYKIQAIPGKDNVGADFLSRNV